MDEGNIFYATAIVVTVPLDPRYFKAPDSTYNIPPDDGFVEGAVAFAIKITFVPEPKDEPPIPMFPASLILNRSAATAPPVIVLNTRSKASVPPLILVV